MRISIRPGFLYLLCCIIAVPLLGQGVHSPPPSNDDLIREIELLRVEIKELKSILQKQEIGPTNKGSAPARVRPTEVTLPFIPTNSVGASTAKVVVVEFTDLQCPFCTYFSKNSFQDFSNAYVSTGKARFMSVDFPLEIHPDASKMALAALCAGEQGHYWEMRSSLSLVGNLHDAQLLTRLVSSLNLDSIKFDTCIESSREMAQLKGSAELSKQVGITGTPTFLIGTIERGGIRGQLVEGAISAADLGKRVDALLAQIGETANAKHTVAP